MFRYNWMNVWTCLILSCSAGQLNAQIASDRSSGRNAQVIDTVERYGPLISPTYEQAVCTEMVLGILNKFLTLTHEDTIRVRIELEQGQDVYELIQTGSAIPTGVYYALINKEAGTSVDKLADVLPGDFVQFWYYRSWGHCGIVHHIDSAKKVVWLYSSYPSTNGYGIQPFEIPQYCFFVRLK